MLTGHLPFRGEHEAAMLYSIVNEEPQPIQKYLPEAPSDLVHILNRLLEKEPDERYQSIGDVVIELRRLKKQTSRVSRLVPATQPSERQFDTPAKPSEGFRARGLGRKALWATVGGVIVVLVAFAWFIFRPGQQLPAGSAAKQKSIAVMYFENKTDEKDLDKILVEMLITNLGRNKEISVVSGQRLFDILKALGKQDAAVIDKSTASEVAKRAGVQTMLLGTIWKVGGKLDVPAQLLDVETGSVLNSDRVEVSKAEEVFSLADRLTDRVNDWLKVTATEPFHVTDATTSSLEAYKYYEKGLQHLYRFELTDAVKEFDEAVKIDSTFAMAHFQSSFVRGMLTVFNTYPGISLGRAKESLAKAKEYSNGLSEKQKQFIDCWEVWLRRDFTAATVLTDALVAKYPDDKEAHWLQGCSEMSANRLEESVRAFEKAIALDPSFSNAYNNLGYAYASIGDYDNAFSAMKTYLALIPDAYNAYDSGIEVYMLAGKFDLALKLADDALKRNPSWANCYNRQGEVFLLMGDPEKAREKFRMFATQFPTGIESAQRFLSMTLAFEGRIRESVDLIQQAVVRLKSKNDPPNLHSAHFHLAKLLLAQNKIDEALKELEVTRALSEGLRTGYNPWPAICSYYIGLCYVRKGDFVQAEAKANELSEILQKRLHDSYYFAHYNGLKAEIRLAQNEGQAASSYLSKALPLVRKVFPRMRILESKTFESLGDETSALKMLDDTYNLATSQGNVTGGDFLDFWIERSKLDYYKAKVYERFGNKREAIKFFQKAIQNWKNADKDYLPYVEAKERLALLTKGG
jgi:tetratricopeptide (TPR) repeat protein/TolB-like protein